MPESSAPFVLVLGMHRSGTSCLAGCLESCGLHLGDVSRRGRFNAKGNRESRLIWSLHDQILGLNRGSWHSPPDTIQIHPTHLAQLKDAVEELRQGRRVAGIKDPRTVLMLDQWLQLTGPRCRLVGSFRHPLAVAQSLARRDSLSMEQSLELWRRYNAELVRHHQARPFPLVEYDLTDVDRYCRSIVQVASQLNLQPRRSRIRRFVSESLSHHRAPQTDIPADCRELYDYLKSNAVADQSSEPAPSTSTGWLTVPGQTLQLLFARR